MGHGMDVTAAVWAVVLIAATIAFVAVLAEVRVERVRAKAQDVLIEADRVIAVLTSERDVALAARDEARLFQTQAEREAIRADREAALAQQRVSEFGKIREEMLVSAKAAVLGAAQELSSKLLDDHKRENEAAKQAGEDRVRQASEHLMKQLEQVAGAVAQLEGRVAEGSGKLETVMRALSNPSGAGQFAEIGLANTLTSFGLEEGRDFALQFSVEETETGRRLRPDAVVFLPGNNLLVIDCKASKFLMDMAEAANSGEGADEAEAEAGRNLARTMNAHLKALTDKDYRRAVDAAFRNAGYPGEIGRILSVMYLPNEGAVEKLNRIDPGFAQRAAQARIIPAGPAGLACIIGFASNEISLARQVRNREQIIETTRALLDAVSQMLNHATSLGRGIRTAAEGFEKLGASVNRFILPRARRLAELGVQPNKPLPGSLPTYQVVTIETGLIEGELAEQASLPLGSGD